MKENKIKNIAIYGSCISKDPFTTRFNKNYKEKYNCIITDQKHSFISTMQKKEKVDESELILLPENGANLYQSRCIKDDLERTFKDLMLMNDIDYLILDVNFEVQNGVMSYNDGKLLTSATDIEKTEFYSKQKNITHINIFDNPTQFFEMWCEYCDKFFNFLKINCPQTKVILAEVRALDVVQRPDSSLYIEPTFSLKSKLSNIYYKKLEDYIKENFNVYVVRFDKDVVLKENHVWGKFFVHYDDSYYINFLRKIDNIVKYDELKKEVERLTNEKEKLQDEISLLRTQLK